MNLIKELCVLVCLSGQFQINAKLDNLNYIYTVNKDLDDVALHYTSFSSFKLGSNKPNQKAPFNNDIKNVVNTTYRILNISDDINEVDRSKNENFNYINETLNITLVNMDKTKKKFLQNYSNDSLLDFSTKNNSRRTNVISRRRVRSVNNFKLDYWTEENTTRRLLKGRKANITHYPFMVSIHENGRFVCSGCIIRRDLVISSASCFQTVINKNGGSYSSIKFRVGSNYVHKHGYEVAVVHAIFHPSYDPVSLRNNLVLLSVNDKAFSKARYKWIKRVKYHRNEANEAETFDKVKILGWGEKTEGEDIALSDQTRKTEKQPYKGRLSFDALDVYNLKECMEIYSRYYVNENNLCAGFIRSANGACKYDVGGPGIYDSLLVGIISFGPARCGTKDKPTVLTRLSPYIGWIHEIAHQVLPRLKRKAQLTETRKLGTKIKDDSVNIVYNQTNATEISANKTSKEIEKVLRNIVKDTRFSINEHTEDESVDMSLEMSDKVTHITEKSHWIDYFTVADTKKFSSSVQNNLN